MEQMYTLCAYLVCNKNASQKPLAGDSCKQRKMTKLKATANEFAVCNKLFKQQNADSYTARSLPIATDYLLLVKK
uniref:Orphan protein n=1 Tax=Heterorhabditis bacteriophora TaxID=37862 RepID=A0A1I7XQZ2_HETBA